MARAQSSLFPVLGRQHELHAEMLPGHDVQMLVDAHAAWQTLLADIAAARVSILVEVYMLIDDVAGEIFVGALAQAVARGVDVRVTIDGVGSIDVAGDLPAHMTEGHIKWRVFNPVGPSVPWKRWLQRNHRKLIVIDERIAHISGRNVGEKYYALHPGAPVWLDLSARVEGPCVTPMASVLRARWRHVARPTEKAKPVGDTLLAHAFNLGGARRAFANRRMVQAVRSAGQRIRLVQAYFLPNWALQRSLVSAARRGVDVRMVIPDTATSDVPLAALASEHGVGRLLKNGVRVFVLREGTLHGKFMVVDGQWWTVGSANMDPLSRLRNLEANVVGLGTRQADEVESYFEQLVAQARELTWTEWRSRSLLRKAASLFLWRLRAIV